MFTFFSITSLLFEQIEEILEAVFSTASTVAGALALVLCVVFVVSAFDKKINKKFFVNNKKFITTILIVEVISCLISPNEDLIKFNCITIVVCLALLLFKVTKPKKETKKVVTKE